MIEIADHAAHIAAEAERIAERVPEHGGPTHGHEALHHNAENVFSPNEPAIEKSQAGRHEHDEAAAEQHKGGVAGIDGHSLTPL